MLSLSLDIIDIKYSIKFHTVYFYHPFLLFTSTVGTLFLPHHPSFLTAASTSRFLPPCWAMSALFLPCF